MKTYEYQINDCGGIVYAVNVKDATNKALSEYIEADGRDAGIVLASINYFKIEEK